MSIIKYLRRNDGDANVSKMTLVAIVFVVGAILLVLITSAFRNPINRWFNKVQAGWFADKNGAFEANNPFLMAERNDNGTIKGAKYRLYYEDGSFEELTAPADMRNGDTEWTTWCYDKNGVKNPFPASMNDPDSAVISDDGKTISIGGEVFTACFP